MLNLITWVRPRLSGFSPAKLLFFFLSPFEVDGYDPPFRGCLYKLFRIVHRKSALLPYLFNHLLISAQTYLFYTLDYNGILLYFVAQTIPDLDTGSSLSWFLCPLTASPSLSFVFRVSFLFFLLALSSLWHYKMLQAHPYVSYSILTGKHKKRSRPRVRKGTYHLV